MRTVYPTGNKNTETFRKDRKCLINVMYLKASVKVSDLMENIICSYFSNCHNNGVISWEHTFLKLDHQDSKKGMAKGTEFFGYWSL